MYVLGGGQYSPEEGPMDIHRLDMEHMIWFQHDLGCMAPQARIAHTCVRLWLVDSCWLTLPITITHTINQTHRLIDVMLT
jgi:hypothetical protein